ncbi:MAG: extracellular solute-binding protein [Patescibacteria group bacterium]
MRKTKLAITIFTLCGIVLAGAGCGGPSTAQEEAEKKVTISIWRTTDNSNDFKEIMDSYKVLHPNVSFSYRRIRSSEYKNELLRAFAEGTGPDIFSIHNSWLPEYKSLIFPLPSTTSVPYIEEQGTIKKEKVFVMKKEKSITQTEIEKEFISVVPATVIQSLSTSTNSDSSKRIFGLPLSVDTLALYYNKALLDAAGIATPPASWDDFKKAVEKITVVGADDRIIQSGAALGTGINVDRYFDIVSVLMMQNRATMTNSNGRAIFAVPRSDESIPALMATQFYTDFANPQKAVYTWNKDMPNSLVAFSQGRTAFFFGYAYHRPLISASAPKLKFDVIPLPQISPDEERSYINYANFWIETVSKGSKNKAWAWNFIQYETNAQNVINYLDNTQKPTARRALISRQLTDDKMSVFANQLLSAQTWYSGKNAQEAEDAMATLITRILSGFDPIQAITDAQNKINLTL